MDFSSTPLQLPLDCAIRYARNVPTTCTQIVLCKMLQALFKYPLWQFVWIMAPSVLLADWSHSFDSRQCKDFKWVFDNNARASAILSSSLVLQISVNEDGLKEIFFRFDQPQKKTGKTTPIECGWYVIMTESRQNRAQIEAQIWSVVLGGPASD